MELSTSPPLDILGYIADMLGADNLHVPNWHAVKALKTLSLTCKFMVPICRRHLFAHIVFSPDVKWKQGLNEFLLAHPVIVTHYLKNVSITVTQSTGFSPWYFDLLQKICDLSALHSIGILSIVSDWVKYSEKTKTLALSLIQQPTIRHLTLDSIINFPVSALSLCSGLKELSFYDSCSFAPLTADDPPFKSPAVTTLVVMPFQGHNGTFESLLQPIGRNTVIAFHCLKDMSVSIRSQDEFYCVCSILQRAVRLERLKLTGEFHALSAHHAYPNRLSNSQPYGTADRSRLKPYSQYTLQTQIANGRSRLRPNRKLQSFTSS